VLEATAERPHVCVDCKKGFKTIGEYKKHRNRSQKCITKRSGEHQTDEQSLKRLINSLGTDNLLSIEELVQKKGFTTDPQRAGEKMLEAAKASCNLTKKVQTKDLLEGLETRRIGTNEIEKMAKKLVMEEVRDERVVVKLVRIAKDAAKKREKRSRKIFQEARKEALETLPAGWKRKHFLSVLRVEAEEDWRKLKEKNKTKKDHLEKKHRPRKEEGSVNGVPVGDEELGEDDETVEVLAYGVDLTENEKEYLKMPNSVTDFVKVDEERMKTEILVMAAKLRMSVKEVESQEGQNDSQGREGAAARGLDAQEAEMSSRRVQDQNRKPEEEKN